MHDETVPTSLLLSFQAHNERAVMDDVSPPINDWSTVCLLLNSVYYNTLLLHSLEGAAYHHATMTHMRERAHDERNYFIITPREGVVKYCSIFVLLLYFCSL